MNLLARFLRGGAKARFRLLGLCTIKDIPAGRFNRLLEQLQSEGWRKTYEYAGFDAWIDYGCVKLRKGRQRLKLEWDNWTGGSVEGKRSVLAPIAERLGLSLIRRWRWSDYD